MKSGISWKFDAPLTSSQQIEQSPCDHGKRAVSNIIVVRERRATVSKKTVRTGQPPVRLKVLFFSLPGSVHPAGAYKFHDAPKLVAIKPGAVRAADIDDHSGEIGEIDAAHQVAANWARQIANLFFRRDAVVAWQVCGQTKHSGLLFLVRTDLPERLGIRPDAFTLRALAHVAGANNHGLKVHLATRAQFNFLIVGGILAVRLRSAMRAKLLADEHHPETGGAGDRRQARPAMLAMCRIRGRRCATHRTI